jgi:hypothetical protein
LWLILGALSGRGDLARSRIRDDRRVRDPGGLFFHRFWTLENEMQRMQQTQLFYRNLIALGAALVFFGTFVTLGSELRFTITAPLFDF